MKGTSVKNKLDLKASTDSNAILHSCLAPNISNHNSCVVDMLRKNEGIKTEFWLRLKLFIIMVGNFRVFKKVNVTWFWSIFKIIIYMPYWPSLWVNTRYQASSYLNTNERSVSSGLNRASAQMTSAVGQCVQCHHP